MIFYFIFLATVLLLLSKEKIYGARSFQIAWGLIFLLAALRFDVGYDYSFYFQLIEQNLKFIEDQLYRIEYLSRQLILFSTSLKFTQFFFIISSLIIYFLFYKTILDISEDKRLSTILFLCFPLFYFNSLSIVRQFIALSIIFCGVRFIFKKNIILYVAIVFIASQFHSSAVFGIFLYFIYNIKFKPYLIFLLYIFSFFSSELVGYLVLLFSDKYAIYITEIGGEGGSIILVFVKLIGLIMLPLTVLLNKHQDKELNFYFLTLYIGIFIWSSLSVYGHAGFRGALYFLIFLILLLPKILNKFKQRVLLKQGILILSIILFGLNLYVGTKHKIKDPNIPYQTYIGRENKDLKESK